MAVRRVGEGVSSVRVRGARRWGEAVVVAREGRRRGVVEAVRMVWRKVEEAVEAVVAVREARCLGLGERGQAMLMEEVVEEPCQMAFETREVAWAASCQSAAVVWASRLCSRPVSPRV